MHLVFACRAELVQSYAIGNGDMHINPTLNPLVEVPVCCQSGNIVVLASKRRFSVVVVLKYMFLILRGYVPNPTPARIYQQELIPPLDGRLFVWLQM